MFAGTIVPVLISVMWKKLKGKQEKRYSVKDKLNNGLFIEVWDSGTKHGINRLATVHSPRLENNSKHI